ncbi:MAG: hypothetical protein ACFFBD_28595 [Candidatus Hodarchaeota archaeon]
MRHQTKNFTEPEHHYTGTIEAPPGEPIEIWMNLSELVGNAPHYTILLPEDY